MIDGRRVRRAALAGWATVAVLGGATACRSDGVATGAGSTGSTGPSSVSTGVRSTAPPQTGATSGHQTKGTDRRGNMILSRADLLDAKAFWVAHRPDRYAWTYTESCFCQAKTLRVEVDGDAIVSTRVVRSDEPGATVSEREQFTVDELFDSVAAELTDDGRWTVEPKITASLAGTFDPVTGHPLSIVVSIPVPDAGHGYSTSEFEVLP